MSVFRILIAAFCLLLCAGCEPGSRYNLMQDAPPSDVRPNILLIVAEDMGPRLGAYGDAAAVTPHLDRLAAAGITYEHAFATSGVCAPSRAALITGAHQQLLGAVHMRAKDKPRKNASPLAARFPYQVAPPIEIKAFPELLRAAGYYTINKAKTDYQFGSPFTIWDENGADADWRNAPEGAPFFAMLNLNPTHEMFNWPALRAPETLYEARMIVREWLKAWGRAKPVRGVDVTPPPYLPDTKAVRRSLARHYNNVHEIDRRVGEVLAELEEAGALSNTIVMFTSDHGAGFPREKRNIYDSGIQTPLIVWEPGSRRVGERDDRLVSLLDIGPTVMKLAGVTPPQAMPGRDFLAPVESARREYVFAARDRLDEFYDRARAVRDQNWKYIRNFHPDTPLFAPLAYRDKSPVMKSIKKQNASGALSPTISRYFEPRTAEELYDLRTDPHELRNLAGEPAYQGELIRLRQALDAWLLETPDLGAIPEDQLASQMWPEGQSPVTAAPVIRVSPHDGAVAVSIESATPGASIDYRVEGNRRWRLYTGAFTLDSFSVIEARAVRYGFAESEIVRYETEH